MLRAEDRGRRRRQLGRSALRQGEVPEMLHQNHIFAVRQSDSLDSRYLVYRLDGPSTRCSFRANGKKTTNIASTNKWPLGNLPIARPPHRAAQRVLAGWVRSLVFRPSVDIVCRPLDHAADSHQDSLAHHAVTATVLLVMTPSTP